ncbi:MAG: DUF349 domain-containing protein [Bacteroidales bacterium]|jgi:hypothetical protein|nr:DUF349 domain-containing protein [Bacteroidales bacterium]MCI1786131.1 DUF349 domain-containing protein [Bacteroidales bacterium]
MSEEIIPDVTNVPEAQVPSDVVQKAVPDGETSDEAINETVGEDTSVQEAPAVAEPVAEKSSVEESEPDLSGKTLAELSELFHQLAISENRMKRYKEAESIKSAFYKKLTKEKVDAGGSVSAEPPAGDDQHENPFDAIENGFKAFYNAYKKERVEYNKRLEKDREENLVRKQAVIEDLKSLVDKQEDVNATFPAFREIQSRWREIGPVPVQNYRDINDTYQFYVEKFYDMVKINHDLRDLDFKKNLEAKEGFCETAEKLTENDNVVAAFRELQKLHEQWKEFGPVAKEYRDSIWERFKAATAIINKKYQAYFEAQKAKQGENLEAKTKLCEQTETLAGKDITSSNEWNSVTKEIEEIQKQWRTIGYATKKENQKIYDRFRAACDKFFARKREFYSSYKEVMNDNMAKKMALIETAESLKTSTEWRKTTDQFISLQKQWKELGAVPRKKSEVLWKRFRAACDEFFNERDRQNKPENDYYANLKAKRQIIEDIDSYVPVNGSDDIKSMNDFSSRWKAIGFVPFKEKDAIVERYKNAMKTKFPDFVYSSGRSGMAKQPRSEKDYLVQRFNKLQQEIDTYENNIGFFDKSKKSEPLINQMLERIDAAKKELNDLKEQIRKAEESSSKE